MVKNKQVTLEEIDQNLNNGIAGADVQRAEHLKNFQTTRAAKANLYEREHARLTLKYGADHPRVSALSNKISVNRGILNEVEQERVRAAVPVPDAGAQDFITHGFVRDENGIPMRNATVAFYDRNGRAVSRLGYACTNNDGYFKITAKDLGSSVYDRVYLGVSLNGARIYNDPRTITPQPGAVIYREIRLKAGGAVCPPPDDWDEPEPDPTLGGGGNGGGDEEPTTYGSGAWTVRGRVTGTSGQGASGLIVSLYDEDLFFDDLLGQTTTDEDGRYSFTYQAEDFRDLVEKKPDLYLKVTDQRGHTLYDSACEIYFEANRTEVLDIDLAE
jgi:protocatechuate 3,4-dioxygenase beta subunit